MDENEHVGSTGKESPEVLPSLIKHISSNKVAGFDSVEGNTKINDQSQATYSQISNPSATDAKSATAQNHTSKRLQSVSVSVPSSPIRFHFWSPRRVLFSDIDGMDSMEAVPKPYISPEPAITKQSKPARFLSQPIPPGSTYVEEVDVGNIDNISAGNPSFDRLRDKRFDSFKTWSGRLERQLSHFRGRQREPEPEATVSENAEVETLPADRYFDALEGPELDTLRASEEIVLPDDKQWPFLLRYPISSFGICLGISSQAIMWKTLATSSSTTFLHISLTINLILWFTALALTATVVLIYSLKIIFFFEAVRREYYHPVRVNFFFAPWIALLFLALGVPPSVCESLHASLWYVLMTPIFCLELKIYGQWMSGGQRRLSKLANPSNHLSIVGNFVGALLGASMGLKEGPIFFFAVGLAHYTVLFVTLYQRLPTSETLPKDLHPVFFLFVAAPSVASMAWAKIQGSFDYGSRIAYFIALFLYFSLAVRVNFFRGIRFSLAWWAYTFPMTGASIATIKYSNEVTNIVTQSMCVLLCSIATFTVTALLITTIIHAFVRRDLFPNDIAIAISGKKPPKASKIWHHFKNGTSVVKEVEILSRSVSTNDKDIEACLPALTSVLKETQSSDEQTNPNLKVSELANV